MNKYYVEIPYRCDTYGRVCGFVFAESQEEAEFRTNDINNIADAEYNDRDTDNTEHYYDEKEVSFSQLDVPEDEIPEELRVPTLHKAELLSDYFLREINLI